MNTVPHANFTQTRHALSAAERELEKAVLDKVRDHFHTFPGTPRDAYAAKNAWTPIADGVTAEQVETDGVYGWWVRPADAPATQVILFIHGGCFVLGSASSYRGLASEMAARAGVATFVLDYPLAPENPFPAAPDAVARALSWLKAQGVTEVALAGDSAGGALALSALGQDAKTMPSIASVVTFSPWLDLAFTGASFNNPQTHDPVLTRQILQGGAAAYLAGAEATDERVSPLYAVPQTLPPILIQVGEDELLLDDALRYAKAAAERGGEVRLQLFEGLHHVFQQSVGVLPSAGRALDDAAAFISAQWRQGRAVPSLALAFHD